MCPDDLAAKVISRSVARAKIIDSSETDELGLHETNTSRKKAEKIYI